MKITSSYNVRMNSPIARAQSSDVDAFVPFDTSSFQDHQKALPAIAKDPKRIALIESAVTRVPTTHTLYNADARDMRFLKPQTVHLVADGSRESAHSL